MSIRSVEDIVERLRKLSQQWSEDILHGHGTVEDCADTVARLAKEIEES